LFNVAASGGKIPRHVVNDTVSVRVMVVKRWRLRVRVGVRVRLWVRVRLRVRVRVSGRLTTGG
jgi:hypothetical protein